jgi:hypothetical protein
MTNQPMGFDVKNPGAGGIGGRRRAAAISDTVDEAVGRSKAAVAASQDVSSRATPTWKPSYSPTAQERATRTYGSPIETGK